MMVSVFVYYIPLLLDFLQSAQSSILWRISLVSASSCGEETSLNIRGLWTWYFSKYSYATRSTCFASYCSMFCCYCFVFCFFFQCEKENSWRWGYMILNSRWYWFVDQLSFCVCTSSCGIDRNWLGSHLCHSLMKKSSKTVVTRACCIRSFVVDI